MIELRQKIDLLDEYLASVVLDDDEVRCLVGLGLSATDLGLAIVNLEMSPTDSDMTASELALIEQGVSLLDHGSPRFDVASRHAHENNVIQNHNGNEDFIPPVSMGESECMRDSRDAAVVSDRFVDTNFVAEFDTLIDPGISPFDHGAPRFDVASRHAHENNAIQNHNNNEDSWDSWDMVTESDQFMFTDWLLDDFE